MRHATDSILGQGDVSIYTRHWLPDDLPRAIIVLLHGYGEHSGRYEHVARRLCEHEFGVYAPDHRGHGRSEGRRVYVQHFDQYVSDLATNIALMRVTHAKAPLFVYGHSMGSLIALLYASQYQETLAGLILSGTALRLAGVSSLTEPLVKLGARLMPSTRAIPPIALDSLSRDPAVRDAYKVDPLVDSGALRLGMVAEMVRAAGQCVEVLPTLRLPVLVLHGAADSLTLPSGAQIIGDLCGSPDTTVRVYDGLRHEVHNEPEQNQVLDDVAAWLDSHLLPVSRVRRFRARIPNRTN